MIFTRREKHVAIVAALALLFIFAFGKKIPGDEIYELIWLLFFVVPVGIYIATDPERKKTS